MSVRQSACDWCFTIGDDPTAHYAALRRIGFAGVEMAEPRHWAAARRASLAVMNIACPAFDWGLNRHEEHEGAIDAIVETITTAAANEIPAVVVFSGNRRGGSDEEGIHNCVAGLAAVTSAAEAARVMLLFEPLNTFDHPDYHADSSRFGFDVVRRVGSPQVKLLYDVYHMHRMGEDVVADVAGGAALIGHMHIAGSPGRGFPGDLQRIDYSAVVSAALAAGYDGAWGHEFRPGTDALAELEAAFGLIERAAQGDSKP